MVNLALKEKLQVKLVGFEKVMGWEIMKSHLCCPILSNDSSLFNACHKSYYRFVESSTLFSILNINFKAILASIKFGMHHNPFPPYSSIFSAYSSPSAIKWLFDRFKIELRLT